MTYIESLIIISIAFNVISKGSSELKLITNASKLGLGAVLGVSSANRSFTMGELEFYFRVSELKAIYFGLQSLRGNISDTHLKVLTDNATAVHSVNNMGSCKSLSCDAGVRIILD